jgi:23S rRNA (guanine745-N1)-methyltransferase
LRDDSGVDSMTGPPDQVVDVLLCPVCRQGLTRAVGTLRCANGHTFDIARQGYVNLLGAATGDTAAMVADRAAFLAAGHYAPLATAVAEMAASAAGGLVVDAGAGTGYYLGAVLGRRASSYGLALDVSAAALRKAARAHERVGAVVWDVWRPWPVRDRVAAVVLNVFAPRNGPEFHRVLRPDGTLIVVTPTAAHLAELAGRLTVDPRKAERLAATLTGFELVNSRSLRYRMALHEDDARRVLGMGPAAFHDRPVEPAAGTVTASFLVSAYRPV